MALWPHSLPTLVAVQTIISSLSAWLIGFGLIRYANIRFGIAAACTFLCAIEPLQLLYERFVMTETLATFLFCVYFLLCLKYLKQGSIYVVVLAQAVAVCLISIRISFFPLILLLSVVLPFLGTIHSWRKVVAALLLSITVSQGLLYSYRAWNGSLLHRRPAYLYRDGILLLGALSPIVKPIDYPIASQRHVIFDGLKTDIPFPIYRVVQTWSDDGLCNRVIKEVKDVQMENRIARKTAIHAALRDPIGVLKIAAATFADYMNAQQLRGWIYVDELENHPFPPDITTTLRDQFHSRSTGNKTDSPVMKWHASSLRWYQFILCFCLASPLLLLLVRTEIRGFTIVGVICCWCFLIGALLPVDHTIPRYLTTAAWMVLFMLGLTIDAVWSRHRRIRKTPSI